MLMNHQRVFHTAVLQQDDGEDRTMAEQSPASGTSAATSTAEGVDFYGAASSLFDGGFPLKMLGMTISTCIQAF